MDKEKIREMIPAYLEGDLQPHEMQIVKNFLAKDQGLAKELEAYQKTWKILGELKIIEPSANFVSQFWTRLSTEQAPKQGVFNWAQLTRKYRLMPVIATFCFIFLVGVFALKTHFKAQTSDYTLSSLSEDELEVVHEIDLYEYYDIVEDIEFYEDLDVIENFEETDISDAA